MGHRSKHGNSITYLALVAIWLASGCASEPAADSPQGAGGTGGSTVEDGGPAIADTSANDLVDQAEATSPFPPDLPRTAEMYWLTQIGWGKAQTDRVCGRGHQDPVVRALCSYPALSSVDDMLRAFWPAGRTLEENYTVGVTYHSAALEARTVSVVNPAVVMTSLGHYDDGDDAGQPGEFTDLAVRFARGAQLVELMGVDIAQQRLNFYLLAFGHACHTSAGGCTATDMLGSRAERDWSSWTLYEAEDVEDTGLSCLSCHQSEGSDKPRRLLMRQFAPQWLHWGDVAEAATNFTCPGGGPQVVLSSTPRPDATHLIPNLGAMFAQTHAAETQYAGIPIETLTQQRSGFRISGGVNRVRAAVLSRDAFPRPTENNESKFPLSEPHPFDTFRTFFDQYCPNPSLKTWTAYRNNVLLDKGLPVPYYQFDVVDTEAGAKARADYAGFLRDAKSNDAFDVLSPLMSDDVATAIGYLPSGESDAPTMLRQMCVRCHTGSEPSTTRRARFNAKNLDALSAETKETLLRRIQLAESDPELMPPRRSGHLPAWAIDRIKAYLTVP